MLLVCTALGSAVQAQENQWSEGEIPNVGIEVVDEDGDRLEGVFLSLYQGKVPDAFWDHIPEEKIWDEVSYDSDLVMLDSEQKKQLKWWRKQRPVYDWMQKPGHTTIDPEKNGSFDYK